MANPNYISLCLFLSVDHGALFLSDDLAALFLGIDLGVLFLSIDHVTLFPSGDLFLGVYLAEGAKISLLTCTVMMRKKLININMFTIS